MALGNIAYVNFTHGQGNDDVKSYGGSSHIKTVTEAEKVAEILSYGGEFGERGISYTRYEETPQTVVALTAGEQAAPRGRLRLELTFVSADAGESGKKETIDIEDFFNDDTLIDAAKTAITNMVAAAWSGINQKVATVNVSFTPRKS